MPSEWAEKKATELLKRLVPLRESDKSPEQAFTHAAVAAALDEVVERSHTARREEKDHYMNIADEALKKLATVTAERDRLLAANRYHHCDTHGDNPYGWGCPDCVREMREQLAKKRIDDEAPL